LLHQIPDHGEVVNIREGLAAREKKKKPKKTDR